MTTDERLLAKVNQAIESILDSEALISWTVAGRAYNRHSLPDLLKVRDQLEARIALARRGGMRMLLGRPV